MKKILVILTTILLSINIVGCSKLTTRYDNDINKIIEHINNTNLKDNEPINREKIDLIVLSVNYNSTEIKGKYLTYQVTYENTSTDNKNITTDTFIIKDSKIYKPSPMDNPTKKVKVYSEHNMKSVDDTIIGLIILVILTIFGLHYAIINCRNKENNCETNTTIKSNDEIVTTEVNSKITTIESNNNHVSIEVKGKITTIESNNNKVNPDKDNKTAIPKMKYKLLVTYINIIFSFLAAAFSIKLYSTSNISPENPSKGIDSWEDLFFYCLVSLFVIAFVAMLFLLASLINKTFIQFLLFINLVLLLFVFRGSEIRIQFLILFLFFLVINYLIIMSLPKLYDWLCTPKDSSHNKLDPAKLTLLWAIISFFLGFIFNATK